MKNRETKSQRDPIPTAEWCVAGVGLLLITVMLAFLTYKALFVEDGDPRLSIRIERTVLQDGGALVFADVHNLGGKTVAGLVISGRTADEEHTVEIDFVPARSSRKFGMFFSTPPGAGSVKFRPLAFKQP